MRNDWGSKEARESAKQLYQTPEALDLVEACFQMMEDWVLSDRPKRWPESFGLVRRALEAQHKDRYWTRYRAAMRQFEREQQERVGPQCSCGSTNIVGLIGKGKYICSSCLHKEGASHGSNSSDPSLPIA